MAKIPNNQVTPRTGSNVPSDRKPDLFKEKVLLLLFLDKCDEDYNCSMNRTV